MEGEGRQDMELQPYRRDEAVAYARHWAYATAIPNFMIMSG